MPRAIETGVTGLFRLEDLCSGCQLREGGHREPDHLQIAAGTIGGVVDKRGRMATKLLILSGRHKRQELVKGSLSPNFNGKDVAQAFEDCEGNEVYEDRIVCGAVVNLNRRNRNG